MARLPLTPMVVTARQPVAAVAAWAGRVTEASAMALPDSTTAARLEADLSMRYLGI
jgi:hypothetical protein